MNNLNRATLIAAAALWALQSTSVLGFSSTVVKVPSLSRRRRGIIALQTTTNAVQSGIATDTIVDDTSKVDDLATRLRATCAKYGQVGSKLTEDQRSIIDGMASSLSHYTDPAAARIDLAGTHELIYSASPSASSGAIGPLVGRVTQSFIDDARFINRVEFFGGMAKIELYAERKVLNENRIRVVFKETAISVFGKEVKRGDAKGSGVWDYVFSGSVNVGGEKIRLRVVNTPSTFVIVQKE